MENGIIFWLWEPTLLPESLTDSCVITICCKSEFRQIPNQMLKSWKTVIVKNSAGKNLDSKKRCQYSLLNCKLLKALLQRFLVWLPPQFLGPLCSHWNTESEGTLLAFWDQAKQPKDVQDKGSKNEFPLQIPFKVRSYGQI